MSTAYNASETAATAIEADFPITEVSQIAEQESWRKEINRPLYHIHKWWATRLGSVFRAITIGALSSLHTDIWQEFYAIGAFTGKVVLDPFMGSGTTLGEALKLGAKVIGCDINPVSTFLVRQAFSRVPESQLRSAFRKLEATVALDVKRYYQTRDPFSGKLIPVLYFFWVKTVSTPDGECIPLFSRYVFAQNAYPKKKPRAQLVCPYCWKLFEARYDVTHLECHHCDHPFNPQQGPACGENVVSKSGNRFRIKELVPLDGSPLPHKLYAMLALRADGTKVYLPPTDEDLALLAEAEGRLTTEPLPLPTLAVRSGHNTDQARGYNFTHWRDFFNGRQLLCLGLLLKAILTIEDEATQEQMLCLFSSTLEFNNLFCTFKGEGTGAVRHMFSNHILKPERTPLENSVWGTENSSGTFCSLFESRLLRAKRYLDHPFEIAIEYDLFKERLPNAKIIASPPIHAQTVSTWDEFNKSERSSMILNGDSSNLPVPGGLVDAVITDPPYFDFVHYSELSDFFFAWLSPVLKSRHPWFARPDCSHFGEVQHKDPRIFAKQLASVFSECSRVLKPDGVLVFTFHHSRPEGWAAIHDAVRKAGLAVVAAHPVHGEFRAASPKSAAKEPISLDAILICRKTTEVRVAPIDQGMIIAHSNALAARLQAAGMSLSMADRFVIVASQTIVALSCTDHPFEAVCDAILHHSQSAELTSPSNPAT